MPNLNSANTTVSPNLYLPPQSLTFKFSLFFFLCRLVSQVINVLTSSVSLLSMWETREDVLYSKYVNASWTIKYLSWYFLIWDISGTYLVTVSS